MSDTEFFDWDDEFDVEEQEFVTLMPGEYDFEVLETQRMIDQGTGKMAGTPYAQIKVKVTDGEKSAVWLERIYCKKDFVWKMSEYLIACGLATNKDAATPNKVIDSVGSTGRCKVICKDDKYKEIKDRDAISKMLEAGETVYNNVARFLKPENTGSVSDDQFGF